MRFLGLRVTVVVGYEPAMIMKEVAWDVSFAYNPWYANTSYITSLLVATLAFSDDAFLVAYADTIVRRSDILNVYRTCESVLLSRYDGGSDTAKARVAEGVLVETASPGAEVGWNPMGFAGYAHVTRKLLRGLDLISDVRMIELMQGCRVIECESVNVNTPADIPRATDLLKGEESEG